VGISEHWMTKSIQQVKQDLINLKLTVAEAATELEELYRNYLELLSHSLKQQLVLACYQICTQLYPKSFLNLSLIEKQDLQQNLRQISLQVEPELIKIIEQKELEPEPQELNLMEELIKNLPKTKPTQEDTIKDKLETETKIDLESVKAELEQKLGSELASIEFVELNAVSEEDLELETPPAESAEDSTKEAVTENIDFENPEHLILWYKQIERGIKQTLDVTSRRVNQQLQQAKIVPNRIPNKVIDLAMQADSSKGVRNIPQQPNLPHLLRLAIESKKEKKSKSSIEPVQISLLRLRLAELEFCDHQLNAKRGKIRNLMGKIKTLSSKYQAIKQEEAVIEAQAAWRSSWYED
jgi:hypothetical protein